MRPDGGIAQDIEAWYETGVKTPIVILSSALRNRMAASQRAIEALQCGPLALHANHSFNLQIPTIIKNQYRLNQYTYSKCNLLELG